MSVAPISQTNTLQAIELANNPIPVELSTGGMVLTPGERAGLDIEINTKDAAEDLTFMLEWGDNTIEFTTKTAPDTTGVQIPAGGGYADIGLWLIDIVLYLQKNDVLFKDFRIWAVGDFLKLEAYEDGVDYTLTFTTSTLDWSVDWYNDGVDEERQVNFKFAVDVYVYKEVRGDFEAQNFDYYELIKNYEIEPLNDSTGVILIDGSLKNYFLADSLPSFSPSGIGYNTVMLLKYFYRYYEKYGTPSIKQSVISSNIQYALNGGRMRNHFLDSTFWGKITGTTAKFLSNHPTTKYLTKQQLDYLYWIQTFASSSLYIRFVAVKEDGSSATVDVNQFYNEIYDVHLIPVNHAYVKTLFSADLRSYTVQVITKTPGVTVCSELRSYIIQPNTPLTAKYYLYKNGLGAFESIMFTGEKTKEVEIDKISTDKILNYDDSKYINEEVISNVQHVVVNKMYTGFKIKDELDAFIDFLRSEAIFEQTSTYFKPVKLTTKKVTLYGESDNVSSASISFDDNLEKNYSNA